MAATLLAGGMISVSSASGTVLTYDYGAISASGSNMVLSYPDGITVTASMSNGGSQFTWLSSPSGEPMNAWVSGNLSTAYTPNSVVNVNGVTPFLHGGDVCPGSTALAATTTCSGVVPVITFTFSEPVTDWKLSINDLGGFSGGVTMYANWVNTSGQTLTFLSGDGNIQVTGGDTIKVVTAPTDGAANSTGVGSGTVKVNGTYTTVSFRLDYFLNNQSGSNPFVVPPGGNQPPDAMAVQWSGQKPVPAPAPAPAVQYTLSYNGNGGTCAAPSQTVPSGTWLNVNNGGTCTRSGYTFAGWNTSPNGTGINFGPNAPTQMTGDAVLYAIWTPAAVAPAVKAVDDAATTPYETPVSGSAAANDTYPAGSAFTKTSDPAHGTAVMNPDGTYTYTPAAGFVGTDSFNYRVCAPAPNQTVCATATVRITVQAGSPKPIARPATESVKPGSTKPLIFAPVDESSPASGSTLKVGSVSITKKGTTSWGNKVIVPGKGVWVLKGREVEFTPAPGFVGKTTIRYRIQDRNGAWAYSTFTAKAKAGAVPSTINGGLAR